MSKTMPFGGYKYGEAGKQKAKDVLDAEYRGDNKETSYGKGMDSIGNPQNVKPKQKTSYMTMSEFMKNNEGQSIEDKVRGLKFAVKTGRIKEEDAKIFLNNLTKSAMTAEDKRQATTHKDGISINDL